VEQAVPLHPWVPHGADLHAAAHGGAPGGAGGCGLEEAAAHGEPPQEQGVWGELPPVGVLLIQRDCLPFNHLNDLSGICKDEADMWTVQVWRQKQAAPATRWKNWITCLAAPGQSDWNCSEH